jgi:hypothetical protein
VTYSAPAEVIEEVTRLPVTEEVLALGTEEKLYWSQYVGVLDVKALGGSGAGHTNFRHQIELAKANNPHFLPAIRAGADPTEDIRVVVGATRACMPPLCDL